MKSEDNEYGSVLLQTVEVLKSRPTREEHVLPHSFHCHVILSLHFGSSPCKIVTVVGQKQVGRDPIDTPKLIEQHYIYKI